MQDSCAASQPACLARWLAVLLLAATAWLAAYSHLAELADAVVGMLGLSRDTRLGEAIHFFVYDTPKVLLLLVGIVFVMGVVQTFFAPERTRALLSGRRLGAGNVMAATLGIVTPFCSCSAVPLFIGFLSAGVPLGVTFSFLISAPMVNEVALVLLFGMFGWKVAALYLAMGRHIFDTAPVGPSGAVGHHGTREFLEPILIEAGLPVELADALEDSTVDDALRAETDHALGLTGKDVGTPILQFLPPDGVAFFGPVISRLPNPDEAGPLWDNVLGLASFPGNAELKRSLRERPQLASFGVDPMASGVQEDWHGGSRRVTK